MSIVVTNWCGLQKKTTAETEKPCGSSFLPSWRNDAAQSSIHCSSIIRIEQFIIPIIKLDINQIRLCDKQIKNEHRLTLPNMKYRTLFTILLITAVQCWPFHDTSVLAGRILKQSIRRTNPARKQIDFGIKREIIQTPENGATKRYRHRSGWTKYCTICNAYGCWSLRPIYFPNLIELGIRRFAFHFVRFVQIAHQRWIEERQRRHPQVTQIGTEREQIERIRTESRPKINKKYKQVSRFRYEWREK